MVPGSTFRYGSHFWRVTRRPRLSSKQPIEAAATPLPSEETTPPVTNIYFGPVRKALEILRESRRTSHYEQKPTGCQITFSNCRYLKACPKIGANVEQILRFAQDDNNSFGALAAKLLRLRASCQEFFHSFHIRWHVHANGVILGFNDRDVKAIFKPAELLELFDALKFTRRERWELQQCVAAEGIQTKVLPMARRCCLAGFAHPGDWRAREIKRVAVEVADDLHDIGIHNIVRMGNSGARSGDLSRRVFVHGW